MDCPRSPLEPIVREQHVKLTTIESYEIQAFAFRVMTGHMAPGKDASPLSYPAPYEERSAAWDEWRKEHSHCILAMLHGFEAVIDRDDEPAAPPAAAVSEPIAELLKQYEREGCDFSDVAWVKQAAMRYVKTMPDSQVRCLLYVLAQAPTVAVPGSDPPAAAVPEGYALVPVEPTEAMLDAGHAAAWRRIPSCFDMTDAEIVYRAMLAAAPPPPLRDETAQDSVGMQYLRQEVDKQTQVFYDIAASKEAPMRDAGAVAWIAPEELQRFDGDPKSAACWGTVTLSSGEGDGRTVPLYTHPAPAQVDEGAVHERIVQQARFRAACYALVELVEGQPGHRWVNGDGFRLKDAEAWVKFYNTVSDMRNGQQAALTAAAKEGSR